MKERELMKCDNTIFADEIAGKLEEIGIEARMHDETQDTAVGAYGPNVGIAIFVPEEQYERAAALVRPIVEAREKAREERLAEENGADAADSRSEKIKALIVVIVIFLIVLAVFLFMLSHEL
jgi:hypothetical protein